MNQTQRIIKMIELLSKGERLTVRKLFKYYQEKIAIRTIQRDFKLIEETDIPIEHILADNNTKIWMFPSHYRNMIKPIFTRNHLLALHLVKSYLKSLDGTSIKESLDELIYKIESKAPGDVFLNVDSLLIHQITGSMDYTDYNETINNIISGIVDKQWVNITYQNLTNHATKTYRIFLQRLFIFSNTLYVIAYFPKYEEHQALAVHRIRSIAIDKDQDDFYPDFNSDEFRKQRFGVFSGKIEHVVLEIQQEYVKWFEGREWHPSQKSFENDDSKLILELDVPLSRDFITWILGWHNGIKVKEPKALIDVIKQKLKDNIELYP